MLKLNFYHHRCICMSITILIVCFSRAILYIEYLTHIHIYIYIKVSIALSHIHTHPWGEREISPYNSKELSTSR